MATFNLCGTVSMSKDSDKFHPFEIIDSQTGSGWQMIRTKFNVKEKDSRHFVSIEGGKFKDEHNVIYIRPVENAQIPKCVKQNDKGNYFVEFADRKNPDVVAIVPRYNKYLLDLNTPELRYVLDGIGEKLKSGDSLNPDELKALGVATEAEAQAAYDKAIRRKAEFLHEWDFAEAVKKAFDAGLFEGKKVLVSGVISHSYGTKAGRIYENYTVNSIRLANADAEEYGHMNVDFLYGENAVNDALDDKLVVNGYYMDYIGKPINAQTPIKLSFAFPFDSDTDDKAKKIAERFENDGDKMKSRKLVLDIINGSPKIEITDDMLTDEQREDLEFGFITKEDLIAELGDSVRGENVSELRFNKFGRGGSTAETTAYTPDQMVFKGVSDNTSEAPAANTTSASDDDIALW